MDQKNYDYIRQAGRVPQYISAHQEARSSFLHNHRGALHWADMDYRRPPAALDPDVPHTDDRALGEGGCVTGEGAAIAEIIRLAAEGRGDDAIARKLGITRHRVRMALAKSSPLPSDATVRELPLVLLHESPHARPVSSEHVSALANSINEIGLQQPIVVRPAAYEVMAGRHRIEAFRKLGRETRALAKPPPKPSGAAVTSAP